jgi:L-seryl-tRNA(Ser) seleniumtransferase
VELVDGVSRVGGGALPLQELKSRLLCLIPVGLSSQQIEIGLRSYNPPVITRVERDRVMLDVRTIQESEFDVVAQAIRDLGAPEGPGKVSEYGADDKGNRNNQP